MSVNASPKSLPSQRTPAYISGAPTQLCHSSPSLSKVSVLGRTRIQHHYPSDTLCLYYHPSLQLNSTNIMRTSVFVLVCVFLVAVNAFPRSWIWDHRYNPKGFNMHKCKCTSSGIQNIDTATNRTSIHSQLQFFHTLNATVSILRRHLCTLWLSLLPCRFFRHSFIRFLWHWKW